MVRWIHWDFSCQDLKSMSKCVQYVLSDVPSILVGEDADDGEGGEEAGEDCWLCDGLCADGLGSGVSAASLEPERRAIRRPTSESHWCPGDPWYKMYEAPHLVAWGKWRSHPSTWQPSREAKNRFKENLAKQRWWLSASNPPYSQNRMKGQCCQCSIRRSSLVCKLSFVNDGKLPNLIWTCCSLWPSSSWQ